MENEPKPIFCILPWVSFICLAAALNSLGPPRLVPEAYEMERVVPEGAKVQLPCPVQADPDTLFFEWYHGKEPLNIFHEDRFRVQSNGVLKIKAAVPEDSGLYICRAVNGFGKLDTNVTLVVLADSGNNNRQINLETFRDHMAEGNEDDRVAPFLTNVTRTNNGRLRRPLGGTLRLYCKAGGNPEPQVTWLRNGLTLLNTTLPPGWKRSRWSLYLRNLQDHDEGNYTCIAYNLYGHANYTIGVDVIPGIRKKPELRGIHPINTTVEEGGSAVFQCRVKSEIIPHVQWLKQAEPDEINDHKVVKVHGEYFKILKSSEVLERADGSFVNKLVIAGVSKKDAGKYICLGANSMGYSFRSAFLTIRETSETYIAEMEGIESDDLSVQFNTLLITIPVSLGILITFLAFLGLHYYCYYYKTRNGNPGLHGNSSRKTETAPQPACPTVNEVSIMGSPDFHRVLESSDGTWSHVQSSLVIDPAQPDSFSECDSSFVFLGDLNVYPDIIYKDRGQILGLYSPNIPIPEKMSCLDRV